MIKLLIFMFITLSAPVLAQMPGEIVIYDPLEKQTSDYIADILAWRDETPPISQSIAEVLSHDDIVRLYEARQYEPLWLEGRLLKPYAMKLVERLRGAGEHGLCSDSYQLKRIEGLLQIQAMFSRHDMFLSQTNLALLDLLLSQAFLEYATHLIEGQVDPSLAHVDWRARRRKADLVKLLNYAIQHDRIDQVLNDLLPAHDGYHKLIEALARYRLIAARGGWPIIPPGPTLRPGHYDDRVPDMRKRLAISGDYIDTDKTDDLYGAGMQQAVRRFQARHGLRVDGVVGPKTLAAFNVSVAQRIRQIELNLERWRWQPKSFGLRHLVVNIADFSLSVIEQGVEIMTMPVVVGTLYRKTPVFSAKMTYLEFAPYWTVPPTILREDKLPKIKQNPSYLEEYHYRLLKLENDELVLVNPLEIEWSKVTAKHFPGILRMEPGPWNPLGRVKFMFPNSYNVYLHDTNEPGLFSSNVRSFSSGCIRIQRPLDLAQYLLVDLGPLDCDQLLDLMDRGTPRQVGITPFPVHIQYWTAWVGLNGDTHFREDVYFRDLDLEVALGEPEYRITARLLINPDILQFGSPD